MVPWDVLIVFLCRIVECAFLLLPQILKEFLDELFGDSWPCGEEIFLIVNISVDVHGLQRARCRKVHRSAFDLDSYKLPAK